MVRGHHNKLRRIPIKSDSGKIYIDLHQFLFLHKWIVETSGSKHLLLSEGKARTGVGGGALWHGTLKFKQTKVATFSCNIFLHRILFTTHIGLQPHRHPADFHWPLFVRPHTIWGGGGGGHRAKGSGAPHSITDVMHSFFFHYSNSFSAEIPSCCDTDFYFEYLAVQL